MFVRSRQARAVTTLCALLVVTGGVSASASPITPPDSLTGPTPFQTDQFDPTAQSSLTTADQPLALTVGEAKGDSARIQARAIQAAHDATDATARSRAAAKAAQTAAQAKARQATAQAKAAAAARLEQQRRDSLARKAAAARASRSAARQSVGNWLGQGVGWVENFRRCIVKRESEGQYGVVDPTGTWFGAYQFGMVTSNEAARRMGRSDLIGIPANRWSRSAQDGAFYVIFANGAGRSHWAGGRYAC